MPPSVWNFTSLSSNVELQLPQIIQQNQDEQRNCDTSCNSVSDGMCGRGQPRISKLIEQEVPDITCTSASIAGKTYSCDEIETA